MRGCTECGADPILYRQTSDNGVSWNQINDFAWEYLDDGDGIGWTADPVVVMDTAGNLLVTYMSDWNITFRKSSDRGKTWTDRMYVSGDLESDKNWHSVSPLDVNDIYVTFNNVGIPQEVHSRDGGVSWSEPQQLDYIENTYFFACGSVVRSDGTVFHAYAAPVDGNSTDLSYVKVYSSKDNFVTVDSYLIDYWKGFQACPEWAECETDYLNGGCSMGLDAGGSVYYSYNGYANHGESNEGMQIFMSYLAMGESNFSTPVPISDNIVDENVIVAFPIIAGGNVAGEVRTAWMDNREEGLWNVYYREFSNFLSDATDVIRVSNYDKFSFQESEGFTFPYGDYGTMVVDGKGYTHLVWGEGLGHYLGGTVMYSTQAPQDFSSSSSGDDDEVLSYKNAVIVSVIVSFLGGALIASAIVYSIFGTKQNSDEQSYKKSPLSAV